MQFVFVDTPGIHLGGKKLLNKVLNKNALNVLHDVDLILWVIDRGVWTKEEEFILNAVREIDCPIILVVNKIDRLARRDELLAVISGLAKKHKFAEIVPVSALRKNNLDDLVNTCKQYLPLSEHFYPPEYVTDRERSFFISENIREAIFIYLEKELPYASHVEVEKIDSQDGRLVVSAVIWVEKDSQKSILIGHRGEMLKKIGTRARHAIQRQMDVPIHLDLWVKLNKDWQNSAQVVGKYES